MDELPAGMRSVRLDNEQQFRYFYGPGMQYLDDLKKRFGAIIQLRGIKKNRRNEADGYHIRVKAAPDVSQEICSILEEYISQRLRNPAFLRRQNYGGGDSSHRMATGGRSASRVSFESDAGTSRDGGDGVGPGNSPDIIDKEVLDDIEFFTQCKPSAPDENVEIVVNFIDFGSDSDEECVAAADLTASTCDNKMAGSQLHLDDGPSPVATVHTSLDSTVTDDVAKNVTAAILGNADDDQDDLDYLADASRDTGNSPCSSPDIIEEEVLDDIELFTQHKSSAPDKNAENVDNFIDFGSDCDEECAAAADLTDSTCGNKMAGSQLHLDDGPSPVAMVHTSLDSTVTDDVAKNVTAVILGNAEDDEEGLDYLELLVDDYSQDEIDGLTRMAREFMRNLDAQIDGFAKMIFEKLDTPCGRCETVEKKLRAVGVEYRKIKNSTECMGELVETFTAEADALQAEIDAAKALLEGARCRICMEQKYDAAIPCGHVFCMSCITNYKAISPNPRCPICQMAFTDITRLFRG